MQIPTITQYVNIHVYVIQSVLVIQNLVQNYRTIRTIPNIKTTMYNAEIMNRAPDIINLVRTYEYDSY